MQLLSYSFLILSAVALVTVRSCEVPHVTMTVQFGGKPSLGTQQASEFVVPLFSDCTYEDSGDVIFPSSKFISRLVIL